MTPDNKELTPSYVSPEMGDLNQLQFNPFQLRMFLHFIKEYDDLIYTNALRAKLYTSDHPLRKVNITEVITHAQNAISAESAGASSIYTVLRPLPLLIAFSLSDIEACRPMAELIMRSALDIDQTIFEQIYGYIETYTHSLDLDNADSDTSGFISKRLWFSTLSNALYGPQLLQFGYPNAEAFSDINFARFSSQVPGRIAKVRSAMANGN